MQATPVPSFRHTTPIPSLRDPRMVLVEESNPTLRMDAHLELGRRAREQNNLSSAETHFREAFDLDPTDERPRAELRGLGRLIEKPKRRLLGWFRSRAER